MTGDRWLYALALASVASGIAGLLVPLYLVTVGAGAAALGVAGAVSSLAGAPGSIVAGRYTDRTGRRRPVVIAVLVVTALAIAVVPFLSSVPAIIAVNVVLALALAGVAPVLTMLVVAGHPEASWERRIARLNTFQGYGATVGLVVGGVWTAVVPLGASVAFAQRSLFGLAAVVAFASVALARTSLPTDATLDVTPRRAGRVATLLARTSRANRFPTLSPGGNRIFWASRALSRERLRRLRHEFPTALWLYFAAATVFFVGFATFWAPLPLFLADERFTSGAIFGLYLVNNVASTVLFDRAGAISSRHEARVVQSGALGVRAVAFAGVGVAVAGTAFALDGTTVGGLLAVGGFLGIVGVSWAFIAVTGTAIVSRHAPADGRGGVLGIYAALAAVAGSAGSLLGGVLAELSFAVAFGTASALVAFGGVLVALTRRYASTSTASVATTD